jgi:hypothetical protein
VLENLYSDVRFALRWLRRSPAFTLVAIASLAIGIGFNTALFTLVDALLFRPLPVERPDRLVDVFTSGGDADQYATTSYPDFLDFKAQNDVFTDMLAYSPSMDAVKLTDRSRLAMGETVTGNCCSLPARTSRACCWRARPAGRRRSASASRSARAGAGWFSNCSRRAS